jgi:aerobic carbon-monoxide dehydrogenase medium subunit
MIPAAFAYERPTSLEAALEVLAASAGAARALAGGQSLLPLMKLRVARPERLVDIGRFEELRGVRRSRDGGLAIGSLTTWSALLDDPDVMAWSLLRDAIPTIGDVQVRNRGTLGGSLAHADPASDIAAAILALAADLEIRSVRGTRTVPAAELYAGPFATTLAPDELITEIRVPARSSGRGSAYLAVQHPASGYPIAGVAVLVGASGGDDPPDICRVALTGVGEMPYRATAVEEAILDGAPPQVAAAHAAAGQRVLTDPYADRDYRAAMARVMVERALAQAIARAADRVAV